jgi:hypothetical protein
VSYVNPVVRGPRDALREAFARQASRVGLSENDKHRIITAFGENPMAGELIPDTGGARKRRFPKPGMGKRSGYRVITYYAAQDVPVFLLDILDKGDRVNLSQKEKQDLKKILGRIADDYRNSAKERVRQLPEIAS